jgi:hypothetical protein
MRGPISEAVIIVILGFLIGSALARSPDSEPDFRISGQVGVKMTGNPLAIEWREYFACVAR